MTNKQAEHLLAAIKEAVQKRVPILADIEGEEAYNRIIEIIVKFGVKDTENLCQLSNHYEFMANVYKSANECYHEDNSAHYYYKGVQKGYEYALENLRAFFPVLKGEENGED
jgi:1,2-phenylacetyl-CoA epoxidase catalytic subunit